MLNAWQSISVCRQKDTYVIQMFAQEPLFYNNLFPGISRSRVFCQHFTIAGITKVWHLRHTSGFGWKSVREISDLTGIRSERLTGKVLREVVRIGFKLGVSWTHGPELLHNEWIFPGLLRQIKSDNLPSISMGLNLFQKTRSKDLYKSCVKILLGDAPLNGVTRWKRLMPVEAPIEPVWDSMYSKLISKRSGDLQWRLIHWIVPSKKLISHFSPTSTCCPFCEYTEDVFHGFTDCVRLVPLFHWLNCVSKKNECCVLFAFLYFWV